MKELGLVASCIHPSKSGYVKAILLGDDCISLSQPTEETVGFFP
jgi:hypothetical protein